MMDNDKLVLMKYDSDCEVAVIASITGSSWDKARCKLNWIDLPSGLENPLFGNPYNLYLSLLRLGFWKHNVDWKQFSKGETAVALIHFPDDPTMKQHWIIRDKIDEAGNHLCYFGKSKDYTIISNFKMKQFIFNGYPNCMFSVYKCNIFRKIVEWIKLKLFGVKSK